MGEPRNSMKYVSKDIFENKRCDIGMWLEKEQIHTENRRPV